MLAAAAQPAARLVAEESSPPDGFGSNWSGRWSIWKGGGIAVAHPIIHPLVMPSTTGVAASDIVLAPACELRTGTERRTSAVDAEDEAPDRHALGYHVILRLEDDRVIAKKPAERRTAARVLLLQGLRRRLIAFFVADTHIHVLLACARAAAGSFAQAVAVALRVRLGIPVPFVAAYFRAIRNQAQFYYTFRYVLRQAVHHELPPDVIADGSSVADLCGLRVVDPEITERVLAHLPRIRLDPRETGLDRRALEAAKPHFPLLADAAAAAIAFPDLIGEDRERVAARTAVVHVARSHGLTSRDIGETLAVSSRSVRRLGASSPCPRLLRAVSLQLRVRGARAAVAGGGTSLVVPSFQPQPYVADFSPHLLR